MTSNNGEKTIAFYKNMFEEGYKFLKYKDDKYMGKRLMYWDKGEYYEYDNKNKLIYKTNELIHITDVINFLHSLIVPLLYSSFSSFPQFPWVCIRE